MKGRVLFPSYSGDGGGGAGPRVLSREASGSFGSIASISSTATEPVSPRTIPASAARQGHASSQSLSKLATGHDGSRLGFSDVPMLPTVIPPTPVEQTPLQLLPSAHPSSQHRPGNSSSFSDSYPHGSTTRNNTATDPRTPNASFSLSEYMNVSPSPAVAMGAPATLSSQAGRRLFEDHHALIGNSSPLQPPGSSSPRHGTEGELMQS